MIVSIIPVYAQSSNTIVVNGEGVISIEPDVARISLGAETQDNNPLTAQNRNSTIMSAVIDSLKALGIDESDIRTTNFSMHPIHDWRNNERVHRGYQVTNMINVTVRDLELIGSVLTAASEAGANLSTHISFGLLDGTSAYNQALALAVTNATGKAQAIAQSLGRTLGSAINVTESSTAHFMPRTAWSAEFDGLAMAVPQAAGGVPVQGGELAVTAHVQITFAIP
ncbi:MAG: SIMPL domain-containing protein [Defluviitaleaceae bacterium]|nr:SIMPL domain-containing protein [Defluviitaleaceae bacterium]